MLELKLLHFFQKRKEDMKVKYYLEDDILAMQLTNDLYDHAEMEDNVVVHFTKSKRPVRIEVLQASKFLKEESKALPVEIKEKYFSSSVI